VSIIPRMSAFDTSRYWSLLFALTASFSFLPGVPAKSQAGHTKMGSAYADPEVNHCPFFQADFLAFCGRAFVADFLVSFALSFAANSCLTLRPIASASTLYAVAASRSTVLRSAAWLHGGW
jgi:hypothetical protein